MGRFYVKSILFLRKICGNFGKMKMNKNFDEIGEKVSRNYRENITKIKKKLTV